MENLEIKKILGRHSAKVIVHHSFIQKNEIVEYNELNHYLIKVRQSCIYFDINKKKFSLKQINEMNTGFLISLFISFIEYVAS